MANDVKNNDVKLGTGKIQFSFDMGKHGSAGGTKDYEKLINQPSVNDVVLIGNKTSKDLKLQDEMDEITPQDIDKIIYGG